MSTLRHLDGVSVFLAWLKTSVPETKISVIWGSLTRTEKPNVFETDVSPNMAIPSKQHHLTMAGQVAWNNEDGPYALCPLCGSEGWHSKLPWGLASLHDSHRNRVGQFCQICPDAMASHLLIPTSDVISSFRVDPIDWKLFNRSCSVYPFHSNLWCRVFSFPVITCSFQYLFPCHTICVGKSIAS